MSDQAKALNLTAGQRRELKQLASNPQLRKNLVRRAKIVLGAAEGFSNSQLAKMLNTTRPTVIRTRKQFDESGVDGLVWTAERTTPERIRAIIDATQRSAPATGGRWSTRSLARAEGVSHSTIHRVWQRFGLSKRTDFSVINVRDVVGLYVNWPDAAMAFSVSEGPKPAIPDGGQWRRHASKGRRRTVSREALMRFLILEYLDMLTEKEIGSCWPHARLNGVVHFLDFLDWRIAKRWEVHVILEILETPDLQPLSAVKDWFAAHARFHPHYPPTKSHWIDEVRCWLAQMPCETRGLAELNRAFENYQRVEKPEIPLAWISRGGSRFAERGSGGDVLLGYFLSMFSDLEDALRSGKRSLDVPVELFQDSESTMMTRDLLHALVESRQLLLTKLP